MLRGCITALVTPMLDSGAIDFISLKRLINWQIINGVDGLVVSGTTGESATLTINEKLQLIREVIANVNGQVKIVVAFGSSSTEDTLNFVRQLNEINGIDYLMCITPYYVKPTQDGLYQHFAEVSSLSKFPLILYNVPSRTGCDLADDTTLKLARNFPNIVGLKDATANLHRAAYLLANRPAGFMLYSGDDATSLALLLLGGDGVISVLSNLYPDKFTKMCHSAINGDIKISRVLNKHLLPLHDLLFCEANPIPVKWALGYMQQINSSHVRLPLTKLSEHYQIKLKESLHKINQELLCYEQ